MLSESASKRIRRVAYADVAKPRIVLDYGHGGSDTGYYDERSGVPEKNINRQIGEKVAELLKKKITKSV
jgi:N-acetylmuramoyl-L-alanine amidase